MSTYNDDDYDVPLAKVLVKSTKPSASTDSRVTALGSLSSQANKSMGYGRIFARAVSNPGPPKNSFYDINDTPLTTLLSARMMPFATLLSALYYLHR